MKKILIVFMLVTLPALSVLSQNNIGIGTTTPNASAQLDVSSTSKGLLIPRMTAVQRLAINPAANAKALMVFDTDSSAFFFWTGTMWSKMGGGGGTSQWVISGSNMYNTNTGNVGIDVATPQYKLDVNGRIRIRALPNEINATAGMWFSRSDGNGTAAFVGNENDSTVGLYGDDGAGWSFRMNTISGKIGIGDANPAARLSIGGNIKIADGTQGNGKVLTSNATGVASWQALPSAANSWTVSNNNIYNNNSGNVGIGNTDPLYPLSFADGGGDKISLYKDYGNTNYYGFGIGNSVMQLMTPNSTSAIVLGYGRSDNFTENMRIKGNGIVGIGESNPSLGGLVVNKKVGATNAVFGSNTTGVAIESSFPGIGFNNYFDGSRKAISTGYSGYIGVNPSSGGMQFLVSGSSVNADNTVVLNTGIAIAPNGNVGIGITNSNAPLQLSNGTGNRKIVLYDAYNNDHQFYGFGINSGTLRYQTAGSDADHVFFSGSTSTTSQELMRIKGNGNVGIGITDPAYKLDVGARMRIRATPGFTAGLWLNNDANNASPAFIGMFSDNQVGFYGSGGAGWGLLMNTQTGAVSFGGNAGQPGQVLTSNGTGAAPTWQGGGSSNVFIARQSTNSTSIVSGQTDIPDLVANFTLPVSSRVLFQYSANVYAQDCFACSPKRVSIILFQNVVGAINELDRARASIVNDAWSTTLVSGPAVFDFPAGTYSFKVVFSCSGNTNTATAGFGKLSWQIFPN
jgi:hypothetical protein